MMENFLCRKVSHFFFPFLWKDGHTNMPSSINSLKHKLFLFFSFLTWLQIHEIKATLYDKDAGQKCNKTWNQPSTL